MPDLPQQMRAARVHNYGGPEELRVEHVPTPTPEKGQVLVRVMASSVNPVDCKIRAGYQRGAIRYRLPWILGLDVAGVVAAVGPGVEDFKPGDEVYGSPSHRRPGCYADYTCIAATELAPKPPSLSFEEAASLPLVALTAWQAVVVQGKVAPGERVFVSAGAGGVGSAGIQIAKAKGAWVATTASAPKHELLRGLGADMVIDYRSQEVTEVLSDIHLVLDCLGLEERDKALKVLNSGGRLMSVVAGVPKFTNSCGPTMGVLAAGINIVSFMAKAKLNKNVAARNVMRPSNGALLKEITALVEGGQLRPIVDKVYPLEEVSEAHRYSETGGVTGKLVIAVGSKA